MKYPNRFGRILLTASIGLTMAGCFSYSKEEHTAVPAPSIETPATTSSSTTTTTTVPDSGATIEKQRTTTTYTNP
jgi:hypothetical protein